MDRKKIGLVIDFRKKEAVKLVRKVGVWLRKKGFSVITVLASNLNRSRLRDTIFIITFGGDGTVLRTANAVASFGIPITRVNFGTVGYLCNVKPQDIFTVLRRILAQQYQLEPRTRIQAKIYRNKKCVGGFDAFNEITVGSGAEKKTAWLIASISNYDRPDSKEKVIKIAGDGLIIATKSGSTGYCLNAGGPALLEDAFAIVASNSWFESGFLPSNAKSLVVPCEAKIKITVLRGGSNLPCVTADCDDERQKKLKEREEVVISRSESRNLFMEFY